MCTRRARDCGAQGSGDPESCKASWGEPAGPARCPPEGTGGGPVKVSLEPQGLDKRPEKLREARLSILIREKRQTATIKEILVATGG